MLPTQYGWLAREPGPRMIVEALKLHGTFEAPGTANNPKIIAWAREAGGAVADVYKADSIPWCGLFMAVIAAILDMARDAKARGAGRAEAIAEASTHALDLILKARAARRAATDAATDPSRLRDDDGFRRE